LGEDKGVVLRVADTGIGIAGENLDKVLQPFVQVESVMSRDNEGAGLGLPLANSFMELHGGTLLIESEVEKGTAVTCCFPPERTI
jgi:signal transduction histidine kinase